MPHLLQKPRRIFVCAHGDLFHENVPDEWIDRVFAVMALASQHVFQVLTKRPERARGYLTANPGIRIRTTMSQIGGRRDTIYMEWPLANVWLGTSVEDQATADARIPHLLETPAAMRFLSAEPLLGPVRMDDLIVEDGKPGEWHVNALDTEGCDASDDPDFGCNTIDWVIVGGESGRGARPMHPDWARSLRDQCQAAGVAFFFKQWGEWSPNETAGHDYAQRIGKKRAGRLLDGREWNDMPGTGA